MAAEFHGICLCFFPGGTLNDYIGGIATAEEGDFCYSFVLC